MFIFSWLSDVWRSPAKARALYVVMTLGFGALAIAGGVTGAVFVAVAASIAAAVTAGLAAIAPKLAALMRRSNTGVR